MSLKEKIVIVDTNVLIDNPNLPVELECQLFVVPFVVIEELDRLKLLQGQTGFGARKAIRCLDKIASMGSLLDGITLDNTTVKVSNEQLTILEPICPDNIIINTAYVYLNDNVVLLSNDFNVRVKASSVGLTSEEYRGSCDDELYTGCKTIAVTTEQIGGFYTNGYISTPEALFPNQFVHLLDYCGGTALGFYFAPDKKIEMINTKDLVAWSIRPKNKEQTFALEALLNPDIPLVTLSGEAGCGKTFLALAMALEYTNGHNRLYKRVLLVKPAVQADKEEKEVGTLPGEKNDKILPWMAGFTDNLEQLLGSKDEILDYLEPINGRPQTIEIESITQMRGRSLHNVILIVDESQNTSIDTIKMIVTRMGEGSKLILTGDLSQIDHRFLDTENNGLYHVIQHGKNTDLVAHVHLTDSSQRSELAAWGAKEL